MPNRLRAGGLPRGPNMRIRFLSGVAVASAGSVANFGVVRRDGFRARE